MDRPAIFATVRSFDHQGLDDAELERRTLELPFRAPVEFGGMRLTTFPAGHCLGYAELVQATGGRQRDAGRVIPQGVLERLLRPRIRHLGHRLDGFPSHVLVGVAE